MRITNKLFFLLVTFVVALSAPSCKKYEDGPRISLRSKKERVANKWTVEKAYSNGSQISDVDLALYKSMYFNMIEFTKGGDVTLSTSIGTFTGTWKFGNDKETIETTVSGKLPGSIIPITQNTTFKILRLKEKELWLEFYDVFNGDTKELHLIPV